MQEIQLQAVPSQTLTVVVGGQSCRINLYQRNEGLFIDITTNNVATVYGVICRESVRIVREGYRGLLGNFIFYDIQSNEDPVYSGLGTRWIFCYLTEAENAEFQ
jgi:hypothetical protein